MDEVQPDHLTPIQRFLTWEAAVHTSRAGTVGPKNEDTKQYIPKSSLDTYFQSPNVVKAILKCLFTGNLPDAWYIWNHYRRAFAILLSIHQGPMIRQFVDFKSLQDRFLPFSEQPAGFPESSQANLFSTFYERQWRYFPLELTYKMRGPISPDVILPFRIKEKVGRGRSAYVDKVEVDEEYNLLAHPTEGAPRKSFYVVKTFHGNDAEKYFTTEKEAFETLNDQAKPPDHLVGFHGSFSRHGKFHLVLEYADQGTLKDFMEGNSPPSSGKDILAFWRCLFKLLIGLQTLHEAGGGKASSSLFMSGWHQDVKPTNVLVKSCKNSNSIYESEFMLADLGLCHFKLSDEDERDITDKDTYGTYAYGAPEAHRIGPAVRNVPISVSQKVDVWSLGCIFSEAATWIGHGWPRVEQYRVERQKEVARKLTDPEDGDLFHDTDKVLDAVDQCHSSIQDSRRIDDFITIKVLKDVVSDMLERESVRANARQAYNKGERAIRAAEKELQAFRGGSTTCGRNSLNVCPADQASKQVWSSEQQGSSKAENGSTSPYSKQRASSPLHPQDRPANDAESPPRISIATMLAWRTNKSFGIDKKLPDQKHLNSIKGRDSVFIIDNSASMSHFKSDAKKVLQAISYAVKRYDPDGVDMICTQSECKVTSTEKTKRLLSAFDKLDFVGKTDMEISLGTVLQEYRNRFPNQNSSSALLKRIKSAIKGTPKPLSLYILTDGVWQQHCNVEGVIKTMVEFLVNHDLVVKQVAIQFIRFGDTNQQAIDLLNHLDDGLDLQPDIVDTTPANGNVWKMILGAVHTWFDKDNRPMTA